MEVCSVFKNDLLLLVEVREHGESSFASELGASYDDGLAGRDGNVQVSGIGLAHLKTK